MMSQGPTKSPRRAAPGGTRKTLYAGRRAQGNIGMPLGYKPSKKAVKEIVVCSAQNSPTGSAHPDKTLFGGPIAAVGEIKPIPLVSVPYNLANPDSLNSRSTTYVAHRGVKMELIIKRQPGATMPITLHYAVLTNRQGNLENLPADNFFNATDSAQDQGQDFFPISGRVWEYNKVLNTRQNHVVLHNKLTVGISDTGSIVDVQRRMLKKRKHYIKTLKQMEFAQTTGDDSDKPKENYWLLFWYYVQDSQVVGSEVPSVVGGVNIPNVVMRVTNYWSKSNMYS